MNKPLATISLAREAGLFWCMDARRNGPMLRIESATRRLIASVRLTEGDFQRVGRELGVAPFRAFKIGYVAARRAQISEPIETFWNGKESEDIAEPGDYIVTNLSLDRTPLRDRQDHTNTYIIRADRFPDLYEYIEDSSPYGEVYRARGVVDAIYLAGGFEILAPWGEMQRVDDGYLVLNGAEVYGNSKETFETTYQRA